MIQLTLQGNPFPDILDDLERFRARLDLFEVCREIGDLIYQDNVTARLEGVDKDGQPFQPLAASTLADERRGPGPPLAPKGLSSRVIANFEVEVSRDGDSAYRIEGGWPTFDKIFFHVTGFQHAGGGWVPERNPWGIRPEAMVKIEDLFDTYCQSIVEG